MTALPYRLSGPFERVGAACWRMDLPGDVIWACDSNDQPRQSPLRLWEDSRRLGPAHASHGAIELDGLGAYSFWSGTIYFSTSDNSDPNTNGRAYQMGLDVDGADAGEGAVIQWASPPVAPPPARPMRLGVAGLGLRGRSLAQQLAQFDQVEIVAAYEPSELRVADFRRSFPTAGSLTAHESFEALAADPRVDGLVIATPDHTHVDQALSAIAAGKPVFLEKPIATTAADADAIAMAAERAGVPVHVGFVLRYAPFYEAIREELRNGVVGELVTLDLWDYLSAEHGASYRRRWHRRSAWSGGLMLHKGCHDIDLIEWLAGDEVTRVSSMGGAGLLSARKAPASHCSVCPEAGACPFRFTGRMMFVAEAEAPDPTRYDLDRCVFGLDQDIVEVQTALMDLAGGARASLRIDASGPKDSERRVRVTGASGVIEGRLEDCAFEVRFNDRRPGYRVEVSGGGGSHGGGDIRSLGLFLDAIATGRAGDDALEAARRGVRIAMAAEESRSLGMVVELTPRKGEPREGQ